MNRYITSILCVLLLFNGSLAWGLESVSLGSRNAGLFSIFFDVLDLLNSYEKGRFSGVQVDFEHEGHYYDPAIGPNWWGYYFEPIKLGRQGRKRKIYGCTSYVNPYNIEYHPSRHGVHHLIDKYIQLKPSLQKEIDEFEAKEFEGHYVIGVHYRGTDKRVEAPPVPYERVLDALYSEIWRHRNEIVRVYVATDEQKFLNYLVASLGDMVCYYPETIRSWNGKALHKDPDHSPYRVGREAVIDCILLSRTNTLIRTSSNLSLCSTFFNPDIPVKALNKRWNH